MIIFQVIGIATVASVLYIVVLAIVIRFESHETPKKGGNGSLMNRKCLNENKT